MRLISITAKKNRDSRDITWGFHAGSGGYRRLYRYYGSPQELTELRESITALFTGQKILERVSMDFIDEAGRKWRIVKAQNQLTSFLEGKVVNLADFLEDDLAKDWSPWESLNCSHLKLNPEPEALIAIKFKGDQGVGFELSRITNEELATVIKECSRLLDTKIVWDPKDLLIFLETLRTKFYESQTLVNDYRDLVKKSPHHKSSNTERMGELKTQIQLLSQMENILHSFGSGAHFQEFFRNLLKCQEELTSLSAQIGLDPKSLPPGVDWDELFRTFAQSFLGEQLLQQGTAQVEKAAQTLGSGLKHHLALLLESLGEQSTFSKSARDFKSQLWSGGKAFSEELDRLEKSTSYKILKSVLKTHLDEFRKSQKDMEELGYELSRVGDLNTSYRECLAHSTETLRKLDKNLLAFTDSLKAQRDEARSTQMQFSEAMSLPHVESMEDLVRICSALAQVLIKAKERDLFQGISDHFQQRLQTLSTLVGEWHQRTNSQKSIDLSNVAIVLSEAHSLLRFKADRVAKLEQAESRALEERLYTQTRTHLEMKAKALQERWKAQFDSKKLPILSIKSPSLPALFEKADSLKGLLSVGTRYDLGERKESFYEGEVTFSTWTLMGEGLAYKDKILILERLKGFKPEKFHLLLTDDGELTSMLTGTSLGEVLRLEDAATTQPKPLESKEMRSPQPQNVNPWSTSDVIGRERRNHLSAKAQEVVDLLNGVKRS